ncbi:MAG TPA: hypothetical protein VK088_03900 [Acidimicrobiia bacterium]|nr:hypothetical protein [Acidimicrobiia bacterium]
MDFGGATLEPSVDVALLADAVQASQGKLFVLGGGWDVLTVRSLPARHPSMGIGLRVRVPWGWQEDSVALEVELQDEDGGSVLPGSLKASVPVRRPEHLPEGQDLTVVRALTFTNLVFKEAGSYSFVVSIDGDVKERLRFMVRVREPAA